MRSFNATQNVYSFWVVLVFGAHMLSTLLLLRFVPLKAGSRAWAKLKTICTIRLCDCLRLRVPRFDDAKLLAACMLWPPACFVSDATDAQGTPSRSSCWLSLIGQSKAL